MALNFHDVRRGLNLDESVQVIGTNGPPVGGDADVVVLGSLAIDFLNGHLYQKNLAGSGGDKWQFIGADKSFREPAKVRQDVSTVLPTATPATNDTQDGITILDEDRVLFSNLTVNPNVYIYDFTSGTYTEDTNEATTGDTLMIEEGTDAGRSYTFNGTDWVLTNEADNEELGFIRTFIGKTAAGSETPTYTSNNVVTNGDNLEVAIGKLDAASAVAGDLVNTVNLAVTGAGTQDLVLVDDVVAVKWLVTVRQGDAMVTREVMAAHDGVDGGVDATDVDETQYASLKLNPPIAGLVIAVDLNDSGASQEMRLRVTTTGASDRFARRIPVNYV